ncbi:MAG: hypothetical protein ACLSHO_15325 [Dysosmobacter sp.]
MQEIVESDLVFNISVYTNDDNIIFYSLPEQHSQPDVEAILEKMEDVRSLQETKKITKNGKNKIKIMKKIKKKDFVISSPNLM